MIDLSHRLVKSQPPITIEAAQDAYSMRFVIRHRRPVGKMVPQQRRAVLLAGAAQLETWALQMREEAEEIVVNHVSR
jgi:hypothetical protein